MSTSSINMEVIQEYLSDSIERLCDMVFCFGNNDTLSPVLAAKVGNYNLRMLKVISQYIDASTTIAGGRLDDKMYSIYFTEHGKDKTLVKFVHKH